MFPFFVLNHTLVKHCHIAPDYRLQIHIHTCLSQRDALTQMQPGVKRGSLNALVGPGSQSSPVPLSPVAASIFFFIFLYFFLAKVNLSNHSNQMCPTLHLLPIASSHWFLRRSLTVWFSRPPPCPAHLSVLYDRPVLLCGHPLPEPTIRPLTSLTPAKWRPGLPPAWCFDISVGREENLQNVCLKVGVCVCVREERSVCGCVCGGGRGVTSRARSQTVETATELMAHHLDEWRVSDWVCVSVWVCVFPADCSSLMGKHTKLTFWLQEADYFAQISLFL